MKQDLTSQDLYQEVQDTLKKTEDYLLKLEKISFSMSPVFAEVEESLDALIKLLRNERVYALCKQIQLFRTELNTLEDNRGYDSEVFQDIFVSLKKIGKGSHREILSAASIKSTLGRFKEFSSQLLASKGLTNSLDASQPKKFLMLKDASTSFLVPIKKKLWQKKIINKAYKDKIMIHLKLENIDDSFVFKSIIQGDRAKRCSQRIALLVRIENNELKGILSDKIEGIIYLNPRLFLDKLEYLKVNRSTSKSFIWLKRRRFFIRSLA